MSNSEWKSLKPIDESLLEEIDFETMPDPRFGEYVTRCLVGSFLKIDKKKGQEQLEEMKGQKASFQRVIIGKMCGEYDVSFVTQEGGLPYFANIDETGKQVVEAVFTALDRYIEQAV